MQQFAKTLAKYSDKEVIHEPALCDADGKMVVAGKLSLPTRLDIVLLQSQTPTDTIRVDSNTVLSFAPFTFAWADTDLTVHMAPFQWDWVQFSVSQVATKPDWNQLRLWFLDWFKEEDPQSDSLLGGVHFLSVPESVDGLWQFTVDFGSAPVESLEHLFDSLNEIGVSHVSIGQFATAN